MLENTARELASNRERLSEVVRRYRLMGRRLRELQDGQRRVAQVLRSTMVVLGTEDVDGLRVEDLDDILRA